MPLTSPSSFSPYPTIGDVMNLARVRVNEAVNTLSGDILTNDAVFTNTMLNGAWDWLKDRMYSSGAEKPIAEGSIFGFPARGTDDTISPAWINWTQCFDGFSDSSQPTLPPNLIQPLSVWRRPSTGGYFQLMSLAQDGLPNCLDSGVYDWRGDAMYFYAASYAQDFRIRYYAQLNALDVNHPERPVEMVGCKDCLSARVGFEYASARGAEGAAQLQQWAEDAFDQLAQRTSRRKQRVSARRQPYGSTCFENFWPLGGM